MSKRDRTFINGVNYAASCPYCARWAESGHSESCPVTDLRAEVADLKARLKTARDVIERQVRRGHITDLVRKVTDLRVKNWRTR